MLIADKERTMKAVLDAIALVQRSSKLDLRLRAKEWYIDELARAVGQGPPYLIITGDRLVTSQPPLVKYHGLTRTLEPGMVAIIHIKTMRPGTIIHELMHGLGHDEEIAYDIGDAIHKVTGQMEVMNWVYPTSV